MSELTLRICCETDGDALRVLAERDTARVPAGRVLAPRSAAGSSPRSRSTPAT